MESIIWFLIIGALFYFMMKFGCGAHMGGHGGHGGGHEGHMGGGEGPPGSSQKVKDPICGMEKRPDTAMKDMSKMTKKMSEMMDKMADMMAAMK